MAGSPPNFHKMDSRSACIQGVLKVKVKVKSHVIRALYWILGMSYSVIDGLVCLILVLSQLCKRLRLKRFHNVAEMSYETKTGKEVTGHR